MGSYYGTERRYYNTIDRIVEDEAERKRAKAWAAKCQAHPELLVRYAPVTTTHRYALTVKQHRRIHLRAHA
jgi:hypothetical protein